MPSRVAVVGMEILVEKPSGGVEYPRVAVVSIMRGRIKLYASCRSSGLEQVMVDGEVVLTCGGVDYTIHMPCLFTLGGTCFMVEIIIPSYDQPMEVQPGEYLAILRFKWVNAAGKGRLYATVDIVEELMLLGLEDLYSLQLVLRL